ncbi:hypothetical protein [Geomicrobium sp. JCM 19039]|uniref:hypothetical protein n=1 Tax=Geomicrobium sp. JCM 19039 TaxID=1460636 RepID=UPI00045F3BFF|nr:hypothetical protein [Geomicrobium sp. JCM 19039]GAK11384.1 hypothetical protein JCM19039_1077 [Geomicrobium sp. JCM 19039]
MKERLVTDEPIEVTDERTGHKKVVKTKKAQMVETEFEETAYRKIDDILKIEDALTRVQNQKQKALKQWFEITTAFEHRKDVALRRLAIQEKASDVLNDADEPIEILIKRKQPAKEDS